MAQNLFTLRKHKIKEEILALIPFDDLHPRLPFLLLPCFFCRSLSLSSLELSIIKSFNETKTMTLLIIWIIWYIGSMFFSFLSWALYNWKLTVFELIYTKTWAPFLFCHFTIGIGIAVFPKVFRTAFVSSKSFYWPPKSLKLFFT